MKGVKIRFECGREDRVSREYGPFEFVQLTYELLRIGPDGEEFAWFSNDEWRLTEEPGVIYSDVILYSN